MQGATEKYSNFIDRLWEAVMNHPDLADQNKQQTLRILAFENANRATKQILASLPKGAGVDVMVMVARVERAAAQEQSRTIVAAVQKAMKEVVQPLVAAVRLRGPSGLFARPFQGNCFQCGAPGHAR